MGGRGACAPSTSRKVILPENYEEMIEERKAKKKLVENKRIISKSPEITRFQGFSRGLNPFQAD